MSAAQAFADAIPIDRLVAAIDSRGGRVVIHGWKTTLDDITRVGRAALEPFAGAFLYTHVDTEGLLRGINMPAVLSRGRCDVTQAHRRGRHPQPDEIDVLDARGIDAVVGMAIYKGTLVSRSVERRIGCVNHGDTEGDGGTEKQHRTLFLGGLEGDGERRLLGALLSPLRALRSITLGLAVPLRTSEIRPESVRQRPALRLNHPPEREDAR